MIYVLVLVTNLGIMTPLHTYNNLADCMIQRGMMSNTAQSSAQCLPTENVKELQTLIKSNNASTQAILENYIKGQK